MKPEILFSLLLTACLFLGTLFIIQSDAADDILLKETKLGVIVAEDSSGTVAPDLLFFNSLAFSVPDSMGHNPSQNSDSLFQMPVFIPDSTLTESMPVLIPPPVDQKMIIPMGSNH